MALSAACVSGAPGLPTMRFSPDSVSRDHNAPTHAQHLGRFVGEHLQLLVLAVGRGDVVDELELAVRLQQAGVRADGSRRRRRRAFRRP